MGAQPLKQALLIGGSAVVGNRILAPRVRGMIPYGAPAEIAAGLALVYASHKFASGEVADVISGLGLGIALDGAFALVGA